LKKKDYNYAITDSPPLSVIQQMLSLPASMTVHNVFHVSLLKKYIPDSNHVIDWNVIQVEKEGVLQVTTTYGQIIP
jgi:hypothetical protein